MNDEVKKAVALKYNPEEDRAPVIVAKGRGEVAEKIIKIAKEKGIPITEDENLVEALIKIDLYEEIPPELYEAVAKVIAFVTLKLKGL
ncbi:EscU/YscU/HrcU family type III secretion system export apparatus switch protein [Aquifex aeolicus]|uniref:EscU/YscU/HrcU family type III secretion system export apparatus switch protein n=1 Tax=Aquifex aeolicus TaxID=63363 RepID=UPI0002E63A37|nr:EscU/YscU/HrcU family type III secretion system export apparatus switch protein [Aquifex aeolicus]